MTILYCGPYFSEKAIREKPSVSQAGARWSIGLVDALRRQGHKVIVVTHCIERIWPHGKVLWSSADQSLFRDGDCVAIAYPNMPVLRTAWLDCRYATEVRRVCRREKVDAFICYNTFVQYHVAAMKAARECGVFCAPIILDGDDPRKDNWRRMLHDNRFASGMVFLSHWLVRNYPLGVYAGGKMPIHHLDGGCDKFNGVPPVGDVAVRKRFTVAHTGSLNPNRELAFIAKMLKAYKDSDTRFIFTGKIDHELVMDKVDHDSRVEVKGMIDSEELMRICVEVDAFISARAPSIVDFPSKLPNYLSWGRPVVSTWVESFSPDYMDFLFVADDNTPEGMAHQIARVKALTFQERMEIYEKTAAWFKAKKTWDAQARALVEWLKTQ